MGASKWTRPTPRGLRHSHSVASSSRNVLKEDVVGDEERAPCRVRSRSPTPSFLGSRSPTPTTKPSRGTSPMLRGVQEQPPPTTRSRVGTSAVHIWCARSELPTKSESARILTLYDTTWMGWNRIWVLEILTHNCGPSLGESDRHVGESALHLAVEFSVTYRSMSGRTWYDSDLVWANRLSIWSKLQRVSLYGVGGTPVPPAWRNDTDRAMALPGFAPRSEVWSNTDSSWSKRARNCSTRAQRRSNPTQIG